MTVREHDWLNNHSLQMTFVKAFSTKMPPVFTPIITRFLSVSRFYCTIYTIHTVLSNNNNNTIHMPYSTRNEKIPSSIFVLRWRGEHKLPWSPRDLSLSPSIHSSQQYSCGNRHAPPCSLFIDQSLLSACLCREQPCCDRLLESSLAVTARHRQLETGVVSGLFLVRTSPSPRL